MCVGLRGNAAFRHDEHIGLKFDWLQQAIEGHWRWVICKGPYTLWVKLNDFTVWRHTWRKNCAVLTDNSAGLRTVFSSRLSHRELCSSLRESHNFLSLPADATVSSSQGTKQNRKKKKKLKNFMGNLCCAREHSGQVLIKFLFKQLNYTV
jgi:hypothetical protein